MRYPVTGSIWARSTEVARTDFTTDLRNVKINHHSQSGAGSLPLNPFAPRFSLSTAVYRQDAFRTAHELNHGNPNLVA